jgi:hypothetical protein
MNKTVKGLIKGKKPIVTIYSTEQGVVVDSLPNVATAEFLTATVVMTQTLVEHGYKLDDLIDTMRKFIANGQLHKSEGVN